LPPFLFIAPIPFRRQRTLDFLDEGNDEENHAERRQHRGNNESRRRDFEASVEIRFHARREPEQAEQQRHTEQNYANPSLVVGFHHKLARYCIHDTGEISSAFTVFQPFCSPVATGPMAGQRQELQIQRLPDGS
jgi:hypothetical protein